MSQPLAGYDFSGRRLRAVIVALGVVVIGGLLGLSAFNAWHARDAALSGAQRELANLSHVLAEQSARTFQTIDLILRDTLVWYQEQPTDSEAAHLWLSRAINGVPQIRSLSVYDATGRRVFTSRPDGAPMVNVSDRTFFTVPRAHPEIGLYISEATVSRTDGKLGFPLSRRVTDSSGAFKGVVSARTESDYFAQFYDAISLGHGSAITLFREDGFVLARYPTAATAVYERAYPELLSEYHRQREGRGGVEVVKSPFDGVERIAAIEKVVGFPIFIAVARDLDVALQAWREDTIGAAARASVSALLLAVLLVWLVRTLARYEAHTEAARANEARYLATIEGSREERQRLEDQLRQAQKMEAMGTLAGGIAHDFNNILGAILGYGEMAQRAAPENSPVHRYVDNVVSAGNRAKRLVEQILAFSRAGLGARVPVNVQSVVQESLRMLAPSLPDGIMMRSSLQTGEAAIVGDSTQIHQVVTNLCTNAIKAMATGGVLEVSLDRTVEAQGRMLSHGRLSAGEHVRLTVVDNGCGIDPTIMGRIFDPFFTTRAVGAGTGLGLALVYGIVNSFGGAIDLASEVGKGTRFDIYFNFAGVNEPTITGVPTRLRRGEGQTVMIVDDEPALVMLAEEMLAELGYEPVGFADSPTALATFLDDPARFDAVLTDETMPRMTGTELAAQIRHARADIPILLMTGYSAANLGAKAEAAGVAKLLLKPLRIRDIAEALAEVLHIAPSARG